MAESGSTPQPAPPRGRDDFLDVIRALAMVAVVANHMTYTLMSSAPDGGYQLAMVQESGYPWVTWPFVWELQAFFLPAAALTFHPALRSPARRFVGRRLWRLLVPAAALLVAMAVVELVARSAGAGTCATWATGLTCTVAMPLSPLWFLVVLVPLSALSPLLARWWSGRTRWVMVAVVVAVAAVSDLARFDTGVVNPLNEVTVWALVWFAGFAYADGSLLRVAERTWWALAASGTAAMVVLVAAGPYHPWLGATPRSMMTVLECVVGVAVLMGLRDRIVAWRHRRVVDLAVRHVGERIMGVFLWHYLAFAVVISLVAAAGVELAAAPGWDYLWQRLLVIPSALGLLALVLRLVAPLDRLPYPPDRRVLDLTGAAGRAPSTPERPSPEGPSTDGRPGAVT